ncbi:MFS family permease [Methanolinea mesophila]|uniref:aromatic aminobenezylarsenical efflux permease ArsG family transporter n=1 Tax=Methanolinea mesophila TaxID=547055 RepID=UPI001AE3D315|nr:aromatic aminobenezylarsenical efflux permease ArsG family transporter [Methanolinea mesophila]MBP1929973.1 MFS family permease [Methanolinea mesophila]
MDFMNFMETMGTSGIPLVAAFFIGLMMAISPCPLGTNIVAIAYVSKNIGDPRRTILAGLLYSLGRVAGYVAIAAVIVLFGLNIQGIALFLQKYGELLLGPLLIVIGILMLDIIPFPVIVRKRSGEGMMSRVAARFSSRGIPGAFLLGLLFSLSFCPFSAVLFFGMLIPLALSTGDALLVPTAFAIATALPVIAFSVLLATSASRVGTVMKKLTNVEFWIQRGVALAFIIAGIYSTFLTYYYA